MKKLFFAVIAAAFVFVSANNVFASNKMMSYTGTEPTDTVAPTDTTAEQPAEAAFGIALNDMEPTDTVAPTETPADTTTEKPAEAAFGIALSDIEPTDTVAPADTTQTPEAPAGQAE